MAAQAFTGPLNASVPEPVDSKRGRGDGEKVGDGRGDGEGREEGGVERESMIWRFEHPPDFIDINVAVAHEGHKMRHKHMHKREFARVCTSTRTHIHTECHNSAAPAVHASIQAHYHSHAQYIRRTRTHVFIGAHTQVNETASRCVLSKEE